MGVDFQSVLFILNWDLPVPRNHFTSLVIESFSLKHPIILYPQAQRESLPFLTVGQGR